MHVVLHHISMQRDHVEVMKPSIVGIEEGHDVDGWDLCVEGVGVFEVVVPNFIDNVVEKLGYVLLGYLLTGIVIKSEFVGGLHTNMNNCRGIVSNHLIVE